MSDTIESRLAAIRERYEAWPANSGDSNVDREVVESSAYDVEALLAATKDVLSLVGEWKPGPTDQSRAGYYLLGLSDAAERVRDTLAKALGVEA